jgi:large repetitive protein
VKVTGTNSKRNWIVLAVVTALSAIAVTAASGASFVDSDPCPTQGPIFTCPDGTVGQPYSIQLKGHDGCDLYWFEILNGALPAGLSMNTSGQISGVPTSAGRTDFYVQIHDLLPEQGGNVWCGGDNRSQKQFLITVNAGLAIVNQSVAVGSIGQPYTASLKAQNVTSTNPFTGTDVTASWSIQSGTLPPGLALGTDGNLTGTPTTEGSYQFVVKAQSGGSSDTETYTISVRQPVVIASPFTARISPKSEVGVPFTATQTATGGTGTYTWALTSGVLPAGVTFDATTAAISGTPSTPGTFPFVVTATDSEGRVTTLDTRLTVAAKIAVRTLALKPAKVGRAYRAKLATIGGVAPTKWTLLSGKLPAGMFFAKNLGTFLGKPKKPGTARVTVQVTDALGITAQRKLALVVRV